MSIFAPLMTKKFFYIAVLFLVLLTSCRSKRSLIAPLPPQAVVVDTLSLADTIGLPSSLTGMLVFDQSNLRTLRPRRPVSRKPHTPAIKPPMVQGGTRILVSVRELSSAYSGIDRVKQYPKPSTAVGWPLYPIFITRVCFRRKS